MTRWARGRRSAGSTPLCGTPEFARWMRRNAARVRLKPEEGSEGEGTDGEEE